MQKWHNIITMAAISLVPTFVLILAAGLVGCNSEKKEVLSTTLESPSNYNYKIEVIEGCEYILAWGRGYPNSGAMLTHKGNCKNPIHSYNVEKGN